MKHIFLFIVCFLLLTGCKEKSNPVSKGEQHSSNGNVAFTFDKANAPAAVKTITTTLSRTGFDSLSKTIDIDSDTSAMLLFQEVPVGTWKVKVDAKDAAGKILYTGQADVLIQDGMVSQVNLVLSPVTTGVGSVQINVSWGVAVAVWKDYLNNPVLTRTGTNIDWGGIGQPKILYDAGIYRMYYLNYSFPSPVSYAESNDGISWTRPDSLPIITAGQSGKWDDGGTGPGPVFKIGNIYHMLYQGYDAATKHFQVGLALSTNGRNWEKRPTPVFTDSLNWEYNCAAGDVEFIGDTYFMYYAANGKIGLAASKDGQVWWRHSMQPILSPTESWEEGSIHFPSVIKDGNLYRMIYMNNSNSYLNISFGTATSADGINWTKDNGNPIFNKSKTASNWSSNGIVYPFVTKVSNQIRIYYTGVTSANEWKIGYAYRN